MQLYAESLQTILKDGFCPIDVYHKKYETLNSFDDNNKHFHDNWSLHFKKIKMVLKSYIVKALFLRKKYHFGIVE